MRQIVDDAGVSWMVYAIVPDAYDDRIGFAAGYARGWLCFQSTTEKWRFLGIPDKWEGLEELALLELMSEAVRVEPRNRGGRDPR